jgi:cold shock CspA family protein
MMSSSSTPIIPADPASAGPRLLGQCKWFSDRLGYGFVTVREEGDHKGTDVFVHHSYIRPTQTFYKSLFKGEYVHFSLNHGYAGMQAVDVTGVNGGSLLCDNFAPRRLVVNSTNKLHGGNYTHKNGRAGGSATNNNNNPYATAAAHFQQQQQFAVQQSDKRFAIRSLLTHAPPPPPAAADLEVRA